jgi:hypothetical protein
MNGMKLFRTCSLLAVTLSLVAACSDDSSDSPGGGGAGSGGQAGSGGSAGSGAGRAPVGGGGSSGAGTAGKGGSAGANAGDGGSNAGSGGDAPGGVGGEGGSTPGDDLIEACLDAKAIDGTLTEALTLKGDGVDLAIVRRRDPDGISTSGTTVWLAQRFGIVKGALGKCVTDAADMTYTISHHNFDDEMTAEVDGQTLVMTLARDGYFKPVMWTVTAKQGDAVAWGPLPLTLIACTELDSGVNCLPSYE